MNATAIATNATPAPVKRGFEGLKCPLCGGNDSAQSLDLDDLHNVHCGECGEEYTLDDVREMMAAWQRVLDWVALAPARK